MLGAAFSLRERWVGIFSQQRLMAKDDKVIDPPGDAGNVIAHIVFKRI